MAGLKELRETILSCALKHSAIDLRGTSEHTKCRGETMREKKDMWPPIRTPKTNYCRVTQVHLMQREHTPHRDMCSLSH